MPADCVLATNTSSISITAIANGLAHPARVVGMHFFNPVALMKLVEVVSGLHTDAGVAEAIFELSKRWGKVPVHARSTPGFIVNRIARPYYAETLALLGERAAEPKVLDACLRAAGFRMGPCELMDLVGHDTNFAVTSSVYEANFYDKRYVPSLVQREMVDGGLLGRKSGRGFYDYGNGGGAPKLPAFEPGTAPAAARVVVHGEGHAAERFVAALSGRAFERKPASDWIGIEVDGAELRLTDGRPASQLGADVAVFDLPIVAGAEPGAALAFAVSVRASPAWVGRRRAMAARSGLRCATCRGHAGARRCAHDRNADQRGGGRGTARRLHARGSRCRDEARRQLSRGSVRVAVTLGCACGDLAARSARCRLSRRALSREPGVETPRMARDLRSCE